MKTVGFWIKEEGKSYIKIKMIDSGDIFLLYEIDEDKKSEFKSDYILIESKFNNKF